MKNQGVTLLIRRESNPPNPYHSSWVDWIDAPPPTRLEIYLEKVNKVLSRSDSPDMGIRWGLNPYRGCTHACAYCYARPYHQYLDWGAGTDFERKIVVRINAAEKLRETLCKKTWHKQMISISGITDCYQPLEGHYEITKQCLQACLEFHNPVGIMTKGALVVRDAELLARLHHTAPKTTVGFSVAFSDDEMSKKIEPGTPRPSVRLRAMKVLHEAGVPVFVSIAPVIPGLNDDQIAEILERAHAAGARRAIMIMLRLPGEVKDVFLSRVGEQFPLRLQRIVNNIKTMRNGKLYNSEFGKRFKGEGEKWEMIEALFNLTCKKLGMNARIHTPNTTPPPKPEQLGLF